MRDNLCGDVQAGIAFDAAEELRAYREMLLIRRFEEKAGQLYALGAVPGPCFLSIGREALAVGLEMAAVPGDLLITGPRCHGHLLARGAPAASVMAELLGKAQGVSKGYGGSIHMLEQNLGFYGGHALRGAEAALGAGLAFASRYRGETTVTVCSLSDDAATEGHVTDTLRLAAAWKLPLVIMLDRNREEGEARDRDGALSTRAALFGIPAEQVDGIDVRKVRAALSKALSGARGGEGPIVVEMLTYRYRGHAEPAGSAREAPEREDRDPIAMSRARILLDRVATEKALKAIEKEVRDEVNAAAATARAWPDPRDAVAARSRVA